MTRPDGGEQSLDLSALYLIVYFLLYFYTQSISLPAKLCKLELQILFITQPSPILEGVSHAWRSRETLYVVE